MTATLTSSTTATPAVAPGDAERRDRVRRLPKAEGHVHLEGCLELDLLHRWSRAAGRGIPVVPCGATERHVEAVLEAACGLVAAADDLAELAYRVAQRQDRAGSVAADLLVNPRHWSGWRQDVPTLLDALDAGFRAAEADGLPPVGLCVSLLRSQTAGEAAELVELLVERRHPRVVALSVDGDEALSGRTSPRFVTAFRRAASAGLRRVVHAGAATGPEGVADALDLLHADRIDDGILAVADPALVDRLASANIPLGVCPTSNVTLGAVPSLAAHPIDALRRAGVSVSVNTDDPVLLGTDLLTEYLLCADAFGWEDDVLFAMCAASLRGCMTWRARQ
ncbi:MAG TPA: adenosine deaminase [Frankiaceae bacterium]